MREKFKTKPLEFIAMEEARLGKSTTAGIEVSANKTKKTLVDVFMSLFFASNDKLCKCLL